MSSEPDNAGAENSAPPTDAVTSLNDEDWTTQIMSVVNDRYKYDNLEHLQDHLQLSQAKDAPEEVGEMTVDVAESSTPDVDNTSNTTAAGLKSEAQLPSETGIDLMTLDTPVFPELGKRCHCPLEQLLIFEQRPGIRPHCLASSSQMPMKSLRPPTRYLKSPLKHNRPRIPFCPTTLLTLLCILLG
jgi:hypothetical protein